MSGHAAVGAKYVSPGSYTQRFGQIKGYRFEGDTDVSFFTIDSPSYFASNQVAYMSSQGNTITLGSSYGTAVPDDIIYKAGKESGLSFTTVVSSNSSIVLGGVYFYGLLKTIRNAVQGDSGGPAFFLDSATTGRVVGIVTAKKDNYSYYTQAACIDYSFGARKS